MISPNNKFIVWLHLSDLHFCEPKTGWDMHRVLNPLINDLRKMENEHGLLPQLLFFTGDAAFGNYGSGVGSTLAEQYQQVEQFLTGLRQAFSVEIPKINTFLVPGNHDVDRKKATKPLVAWIEMQNDKNEITELIRKADEEWKPFMERLTIYRQFLETHNYPHLLGDPDRLIYHEVREINGIKIGIGGFNSAWNCSRDKEKGKLWLGADWQKGTIINKLNQQKTDLKLALIHHPPGWFVEQEDAKIRTQMEMDFDFFLHGHEHQGWVNPSADGHVRIAAAACYESSDQENGYNFVRLNLETGDVEVWLRKFDGHGGGWIPRVVANKTNNDGLWSIKGSRISKIIKLKGTQNFTLQETVFPSVSKIFPDEKKIPSSVEPSSTNASENPIEIKDWQKMLINRISEQMQHAEIQSVVLDYLNSLQGERAIPCSPPDWDGIAEYLVKNQDDGEIRFDRVLTFLNIANAYVIKQNNPEPLYELFAYLLQTLVRKCGEEEKGLSKIPVSHKQTVELINACQSTTALVPGYSEDNLEFKSGKRNSRLAKLGDFQAPIGSWDIDRICLEMAQKLLEEMGVKDFSPANALNVLMGRLNRHRLNPNESPLQGVYIEQEQLLTHPLGVQSVAENFREKTKNRLGLYVYGITETSDDSEILHTNEENIRGMVMVDNNVVDNYIKINRKEVDLTQQNPAQANNMNSGINLSNIGSNTTINVVPGTQTNTQIGQGNIQISGENTVKLLELLQQLKSTAHQDDNVFKQDYATINQAATDIETEIKKKSGADKSVLASAKEALGNFEHVASIAGSIEKITELLLPLLG